jgi:hypothetical protein
MRIEIAGGSEESEGKRGGTESERGAAFVRLANVHNGKGSPFSSREQRPTMNIMNK